LFVAAGIFDHYITIVGLNVFVNSNVLHLAVTSVLMAAKLEQPISPSFNRMINLLPENERKHVSKAQLIELEQDIIRQLGFDFNFPGPLQSMERFLRLLEYDQNLSVVEMTT
jgi:hypothetical protein